MAAYFSYFPSLVYTLDANNSSIQILTNIFARSTFLKNIAENTSAYFKYSIKDSDTPEIIADKIYGDPFRAWIVLLFNNIVNPNYDWPLKSEPLEDYIVNKYNQTIDEAKSTIHHYEQEVAQTISMNGMVLSRNSTSITITDKTFNYASGYLLNSSVPTIPDTSLVINPDDQPIDLGNGQTLEIVITNTSVSNYMNEVNENEKKREIKLLNVPYVTLVENEFKKLMS